MVHGKGGEVFNLENKFPYNTKKLKTDIITNFTEYGLSCDLLIYTPTITIGVSFNELYCYRIFGYCSNGNKVNRCFLQQLNHIRFTEVNDYHLIIQKNLICSTKYVPKSLEQCIKETRNCRRVSYANNLDEVLYDIPEIDRDYKYNRAKFNETIASIIM